MRNGCCGYCYGRLPIDDYTKDEFLEAGRMKVGDACVVCNNVYFNPGKDTKIYLVKP
jgi:hypothetical protein